MEVWITNCIKVLCFSTADRGWGVGFGAEGGLLIWEAAHWCIGNTSTVFFTKSWVQQPFSKKEGSEYFGVCS